MAIAIDSQEKERVERFTRALGIALLDKKLEMSGTPILYFCDADVVLHMILGFERSSFKSDQELVLSLFSLSFLSKVSVLRPHALEIDRKVRRQPKPASVDDLRGFQNRARKFLQEHGITSTLERLHQVVKPESGLGKEEQIDRFIEILKDSSTSTFTAIEQICGIWTQRWNRFHEQKLLDFDHLGPALDKFFERSRTRIIEIFGVLQSYRPKYRDSNLQDSIALAMLADRIEDWKSDPSVPLPRFYTDTEKLNQACFQDPLLRGLLRHEPPGFQNAPEDFALVIRDSSYFLTRARFQELAFHSKTAAAGLADLEQLYEELSILLTDTDNELVKALHRSGLKLRDEPLSQVIDEFETLSLMRSIWVRNRLPDFLLTAELSEWTDVFKFAERNEMSDKLLVQIDHLQSELSEKVRQDWRWTRDYEAIAVATKDRKEAIKGVIRDPMRDLGLVRWGYNLSNENKEMLADIVKTLLESHDDEKLIEQAGRMASQLELARTNLDTCLIMGAALWTLGMFERVSELVDELKQPPPSLVLLQAASLLRARRITALERKKELIDHVLRLRDSIPPSQLGGYLLGLGYVLYRAWQSEVSGVNIEASGAAQNLPPEVANWAELCFKAGKEAEEILRRHHDLAWAFAVNHCAYVALVTNRDRADIDHYFRTLRDQLGVDAVWNSRFDDTLGCYYLVLMEREWASTPPEKRCDLNFRKRIRNARKHFDKAEKHDFGDIDLKAHIERLESLESDLEGCRRNVAIQGASSTMSPRSTSS